MRAFDRRDFNLRILMGTAISAGTSMVAMPWKAFAARPRRRTADLVIDSIRWSDDYGGSWHTAPVLAGSHVWFEATVRNAGSSATPPRKTLDVEFRVNGNVVSWSDTIKGGLAASQSATIRADGGPNGNEFWVPATPGNQTVQAVVDHRGRISESNENTNSGFATLEVGPVDARPVANDDSVQTQINTTVNIDVLANDVAPSGQELVVASVQSPTDQGGTAVIAADGRSVVYTPPPDLAGQDSFTYEAAPLVSTTTAAATATVRVAIGVGLFTTLSVSQDVIQSSAQITATALEAPANSGDFIGLYSVSEPNSSNWISRQLVSIGQGTKHWTATMPAGAGDYHFRYVTAASACVTRSQRVTVVAGRIYTVGGSSPDFASPSAAAGSMSGGDLALIRDGTYGGFTANRSNMAFRAENRHGVTISGTDTVISGSGTGITLRGLIVQGDGGTGTGGQFSGLVNVRTGWTLEDVIVANSDDEREGIRSAGGGAVANNYRIERCIVQDNRGNGIWGRPDSQDRADHDRIIVKDTVLRRNNQGELNPGLYNGGCKMMYTNNLLIDGLISYDNYGTACWLDFGSTNYSVQHCTLFASHGTATDPWDSAGLYIEANPGPGLIQNNVIYSNIDYGIIMAESQNIVVQNNLIVDTTNAWGLRTVSGRPAPNNIDLIGNITDGNTPTRPGTDIVEIGTITPGPFAGPTQNVSEGASYTSQVTQQPESETIGAAIAAAGAVVGNIITLPVHGRKVIVADGSQWSTELYDLNCRYVRVTIPTSALRDEIEAQIQQYASIQARDATVRLSVLSANGYEIEGVYLGQPSPAGGT
jgi:Bacterial Ig domain/Right handed beta helix region